MTPTKDTIQSLIQKFYAYLEAGDLEGWLSLCTDDLRWTMIGMPTVEGKEAVRAFMGSIPSGPPPNLTIKDMIVDGEMTAITGEMNMTNEQGMPAKYAYCDIYRFEGEKFAEMTTYILELKDEPAGV